MICKVTGGATHCSKLPNSSAGDPDREELLQRCGGVMQWSPYGPNAGSRGRESRRMDICHGFLRKCVITHTWSPFPLIVLYKCALWFTIVIVTVKLSRCYNYFSSAQTWKRLAQHVKDAKGQLNSFLVFMVLMPFVEYVETVDLLNNKRNRE
jgi:hypothetical protein